jgi:type IV pilus assembly protein PilA
MDVIKNKKGFTLVELLAVIAILSILVVIALPNVINMFQGAKKGTFKTEVQQIMRQAESTWVLEGGADKCYYHKKSASDLSQLSLQGTELNYVVKINSSGAFTKVVVVSDEYAFNSATSNIFVASKIQDTDIYASGASGTEGTNFTTASGLFNNMATICN